MCCTGEKTTRQKWSWSWSRRSPTQSSESLLVSESAKYLLLAIGRMSNADLKSVRFFLAKIEDWKQITELYVIGAGVGVRYMRSTLSKQDFLCIFFRFELALFFLCPSWHYLYSQRNRIGVGVGIFFKHYAEIYSVRLRIMISEKSSHNF